MDVRRILTALLLSCGGILCFLFGHVRESPLMPSSLPLMELGGETLAFDTSSAVSVPVAPPSEWIKDWNGTGKSDPLREFARRFIENSNLIRRSSTTSIPFHGHSRTDIAQARSYVGLCLRENATFLFRGNQPDGRWRSVESCIWNFGGKTLFQGAPKHRLLLPDLQFRSPKSDCWAHSELRTEHFQSKQWLQSVRPQRGHIWVLMGHSHIRVLFFSLCHLLLDIAPHAMFFPYSERNDAFLVDASNETVIIFLATPSASEEDLDRLDEERDIFRMGATTPFVVIVGRGMWEMDAVPAMRLNFLRETSAYFWRKARLRFPRAILVSYLTHFVHTPRGGCTTILRQLQFRDAIACGVTQADVGVHPFDVFDITATTLTSRDVNFSRVPRFDQRSLRPFNFLNVPISDGQHFNAPLMLNVALKLLSNLRAPPNRILKPGVRPQFPILQAVSACTRCLSPTSALFRHSWCEVMRLRSLSTCNITNLTVARRQWNEKVWPLALGAPRDSLIAALTHCHFPH